MEKTLQRVHVYCAEETVRERDSKRERGGEERSAGQAGSFKEFVKRQSLSLIMRFSRSRSSFLSCPSLSLSRTLVNSLSVLLPHCRCLRQLRYTKAKSEKQTAKSQKRRAEWHVKICKCRISKVNELSLVYGSVWATGGWLGVESMGAWREGFTALHFPLIKYNGPRHKTRVVKHSAL